MTGGYKRLQGLTGGHSELQGVTRCDSGLRDITGDYKGLQKTLSLTRTSLDTFCCLFCIKRLQGVTRR